MGKIGEIKEYLDAYLETRDDKYLEVILEKSEYIAVSATKNVLKNNDISFDRMEEYIGAAYVEILDKLSCLTSCDKKAHEIYTYLYRAVSNEVERQIKAEKQFEENTVPFSSLRNNLEELSKHGLVDDSLERVESDVDLVQKKKALRKVLEQLNEKQRKIVEMYFGFDDGNQKSLQDVADVLGVQRGYVFYVVSHSLMKMRSYIYKKGNKSLKNKLLK